MYIQREIEKEILYGAEKFPVVTLTGPRQSGKTTLLKHIFQDKKYYSLENPDIYELAKSDPVKFLTGNQKGVILDEIQRVPELLSYIQGIVDERKMPGQFILSGSQQFNLMSGITQSLAGRSALYTLLPFDFNELGDKNEKQIEDIIYKGFYPRIWDQQILPTKVYTDYFELYIQRDLRQLLNIKDLDLFRRFVKLCAGRVGQVFIASHLSNELGVSVHTVNSWLSILETSYIIFQLPPYFSNLNKRLIKSKKIYFYDVGLACAILGIQKPEYLENYPLSGALFENLVISDLIKSRKNGGFIDNYYFYRDSNQNEVDLILDNTVSIDAIEIKSAKTFHKDLLKGLAYIRKIMPDKVGKTYLCYAGKPEQEIQKHHLVNFRNLSNLI